MAFTTDLSALGLDKNIPNDKLLKLEEVMELLACRKNCVYNMVNAKTFPAPIKVGPKLVRWSLSEIEAWIEEQKNNR